MDNNLDLGPYDCVIFDMDGVLIDSNAIKARNIRQAALEHCAREDIDRFVEYFVAGNGLPREVKIYDYFDAFRAEKVLLKYNRLNELTLKHLDPIDGVRFFLDSVTEVNKSCHVITGGSTAEALMMLKGAGLLKYFDSVHGGPATKEENYSLMKLEGKHIYFGDSQYDYEFARQCGIQFVYVYGHSSWPEGRHLLVSRSDVVCIHSFRELTDCSLRDRG